MLIALRYIDDPQMPLPKASPNDQTSTLTLPGPDQTTAPRRDIRPEPQTAWIPAAVLKLMPGLALVGALAACSLLAARSSWAQQYGLSALTLAIVIGMLIGNTLFPRIAPHTAAGVDFSKGILLRAGIILFGFRITFQQIADIGLAGIVIAVVMVGLTFLLATWLGTRVFGLDRQTSMLIGAGSAICGAAAVMAAEPVVRGQAHKVSIAVATVVVFGTISMFLYPVLHAPLGMTDHAYGVFAGSTIHEVAQVVAAGKAVSEEAMQTAVIEKMLRVMLLAPFLLILSAVLARRTERHGQPKGEARPAAVVIPWFAVGFIAAAAFNSLQLLPTSAVDVVLGIDTLLLAMAMAALGLRTHAGAIRQAGARPLLLASALFIFLVAGGYGLNLLTMKLLG